MSSPDSYDDVELHLDSAVLAELDLIEATLPVTSGPVDQSISNPDSDHPDSDHIPPDTKETLNCE